MQKNSKNIWRTSSRRIALITIGIFSISLISSTGLGVQQELPVSRVGEAYCYTVGYQGLVEPVKVEWHNAPEWLVQDGISLKGTPETATLEPVSFSVDLTGQLGRKVHGEFSLSVLPAIRPLRLNKSKLPPLPMGEESKIVFNATGGEGKLNWKCEWIKKLPGLECEVNAEKGTCKLVGNPQKTGTFSIEVMVVDESRAVDRHRFTGRVCALASPLDIVTTDLPRAVVGDEYQTEVVAEGGRPPYDFTIVWQDDPPQGLNTEKNGGEIKGAPVRLGAHPLTVTVKDRYGTKQTKELRLFVEAPECEPFLVVPDLPPAVVNQPFTATIAAGGLAGNCKWELSGAPSWLDWEIKNDVCCRLSGVPTEAGRWKIVVRVDALCSEYAPSGERMRRIGNATSRLDLKIETEDIPPLKIMKVPPAKGIQNQSYQCTFSARGGKPPIHFSFEGKLPIGMDGKANGFIASEQLENFGRFPFTVVAESSDGQKSSFQTELTVIPAELPLPLGMGPIPDLNGLFFMKTIATVPIHGGVPPYRTRIESVHGMEVLDSESEQEPVFRLWHPLGVNSKIVAEDSTGRQVSRNISIRTVVPLEYALLSGAGLLLLAYLFHLAALSQRRKRKR